MKLKITPLIIILVILLVLVIFAMICQMPFMQEGFVSFKQTEEDGSRQVIPQYSTNERPYKLYDSLYFDNLNGNLIEVDSAAYDSGNVDMTGNTITSISVLPRTSNDVYTYEITSTNQKLPTQSTTLNDSYKSMIYRSESDSTDKYTVFYMPWGKKTFLHVINTTPDPHLSEHFYLFSDTSVVYSKDLNSTPLDASSYVQDVDSDNNYEVIVSNYNSARKVYQVSKHVKYDMKNGNLLVTNNQNNSIELYKRNNENKISINVSSSTDERTFGNDENYTSVDFSVRLIKDESGANTVLFVCQGFDSLVAVIGKDYQNNVVLKTVKRFNPNGVDTGDGVGANRTFRNVGGQENGFQDFLNQYLSNMNEELDNTDIRDVLSSLQQNNNSSGNEQALNLDNYILKTQVVPPVCPACPACPSAGCNADKSACSNCGGNGGSGTLTDKGDTTATGDAVSQNKEKNLTDTVGSAAENTVGAVGDVASSAVGTVGDVTSGAIGAVGDVASGAIGAVGDVASGLIKSGSDVVKTASDNVNEEKKTTGLKEVEGTADPYSYYGQVPYKPPSEFVARTADFSSFGR